MGGLSIRGKLFDGKVTGDKAKANNHCRNSKRVNQFTLVNLRDTLEVKVQSMHMFQDVLTCLIRGCTYVTAECRPISKSVSYVVIEVKA